MAAGVTDLRQRVHLGQQRDAQRCIVPPPARQEGGLQAGDRALQRESPRATPGLVALRGLVFLEGELRVCAHPARQLERLRRGRPNGREQRALSVNRLFRSHSEEFGRPLPPLDVPSAAPDRPTRSR